jgi:RNA polymerase sigma-70 factor (ECF subfamily)
MSDGDTDLIARLATQYGEMVFATVYRILGDADDAEDAFQEVFLKVMASRKRSPNSRGVDDWGAYLRVVAIRSAIDLRRRESYQTRNRGTLTGEIQDSTAQRPDEIASRRQRAEALRQAMTSLTDRDATVFALRCFEDFSYEMIAAEMEISVNQVGVILHRARKLLQETLQTDDDVMNLTQRRSCT